MSSAMRAGFLCFLGLLIGGCASGGGTSADPKAARPTTDEPARVVETDRRALVLDGSVIGWDRLRPSLAEAAGRTVIEELVLDRALAREAARRGIAVTPAMIDDEERALLDELGTVGAEQIRASVLEQIRRSRGLGPTRYAGLLKRNATLRALIGDDGEPSVEELELARMIAFGETRRVRLFVSASDGEAGRTRRAALDAPTQGRAWVFAERCANSTHPSAARGGLIERFSASDPAYPDVVRDAVSDLAPGSVSSVLATPAGFAVLYVESIDQSRRPHPDEVTRVDRRVKIRKQRIAMERLAADLLARADVSPVDPDLARAWRDR